MRVYLLRHGEVTSHRGDVPITEAAKRHAFDVGERLAREEGGSVRVLSGETTRAIDTAAHLARGLTGAGVSVDGPEIAFALRNPDLYVSGVRVNMVSSADALAQQVEGLTPEGVAHLEFFPEFFSSPDRIGWWLTHPDPPGEGAVALGARVRSFLASLGDPVPNRVGTVVAVTHSPLLRAVGLDLLGRDIGEPPWVSGLLVEVQESGAVSSDAVREVAP